MTETPTRLTLEVAEQFLVDDASVDLRIFTEIEDTAAKVLAAYQSDLLLDGLHTLSDAAAASLRWHEGGLILDGLHTLSDTAAESLSRHDTWLSLGSLHTLSDAAAESLSQHKELLILNGLTTLSDAAAESLSRHEGWLELNGLTTLSEATVDAFSQREGGLSVRGLTRLSDAAAASLCRPHRFQLRAASRGHVGSLASRMILNASVIVGATIAIFLYVFVFDRYSERELVRLSYCWIPLLAFGLIGHSSRVNSGKKPILHGAIGAVASTGGLILFFETIFPGL